MMIITKLSKNLSPLCFLPCGALVCYKNGLIYIIEDGVIVRSIRIRNSIKERLFGRCRFISRLLRIGVRCAIALDNSNIILSFGCRLFELNLESGKLSSGVLLGSNIRPLTFSNINGLKSFDDGIYFGGYDASNFNKEPVSIYKRVSTDKWDVVYTFPKGVINHIHNVVPDKYRNCTWIFTGDFDEAAAIWKSDDGFKTVKRIFSGNQKYRGCSAFAMPEGLIYATDSPFAPNYIYCISPNLQLNTLKAVSGSCIYGCCCNGKLYFSSTVEPDGRNETLLKLLFDYRIGDGIKDKYARIYQFTSSQDIVEIFKAKKDSLPFIFQFGTFKFPSGNNGSNSLYFQPTALSNIDMNLMRVNNL